MSRDFRLYLSDIVESCDQISEYIYGHNFQSFSEDRRTIDAVVRNLEIIGEAAKNVSREIRDRRPEIAWTEIMKFRNVIAHEYFRVKLRVVWDIARNKIDNIRNAAASLYTELS